MGFWVFSAGMVEDTDVGSRGTAPARPAASPWGPAHAATAVAAPASLERRAGGSPCCELTPTGAAHPAPAPPSNGRVPWRR